MKNLILILLSILTIQVSAVEIWVSKTGNDKNAGTKNEPMATLFMAQRKVRELRRLNHASIQNGVSIILKEGTYFMEESVSFRPEDAGTFHSPTIVKGADGQKAVLSGGKTIGSWQKAGSVKGLPKLARGKVWVANAPKVGGRTLEFRQMWVNGTKATRASTLGDGLLPRILSVDKENETFGIPTPNFKVAEMKQLEFVIHQWWAIANLRVADLVQSADSAIVSFHQPESRIEFEHPWPAPYINNENNPRGNSAFYFVGALELLNQPGEWCEDFENGKVYYWPKENENLNESEVVVPYLETLIRLKGTAENPVSNITFQNINFEHAAFMRPSQAGHVPLQAGFYLLDAYSLKIPGTPDKAGLENQAWLGRQPGAVEALYSTKINFERCNFVHHAATGIDFVIGTNNCKVEACIFKDIGGTGIQGGYFGDDAFEAHLPYNPKDGREVVEQIYIANNFITDCTNEDWGCVGISFGFASDINIEHNEISHINYSGICTGWGWTPTLSIQKNNRVHANYIHHFAKMMYDVGGFYNLSLQPKMEVSNNRIEKLEKAPYAHIPEHYQYIYLDERSSYLKIFNNWTETDKYFSNTPGPGNEWTNNGPQVSEEIKNAAGIQPEFQYIMENAEKL